MADSDDTPAYVLYGNILLPFGLSPDQYDTLLAMGGAIAQGQPGAPPVESIAVLNARGNVIPPGSSAAARAPEARAMSSWSDPTVKHLRVLRPDVARAAYELVRAARLNRIPLWISSSIRTAAHQSELVQAGRSMTERSLHVGRPGEIAAFDVDVKGVTRDRVPMRVWQYLGPLGESYGLRWGGRWPRLRDLGHFEGTGGFRSGRGF